MFYRLIEIMVRLTGNTSQKRWYAKEVTVGRSTLAMIARSISTKTTLTHTDIIAVLNACVEDIGDRLRSGQIVELGDLGNFQLIIRNNGGAQTEKSWTPDLIKGAHLLHRATKTIKSITNDVPFNRWKDFNEDKAIRAVRKARFDVSVAEKKMWVLQENIARLLSAKESGTLSKREAAELIMDQAELALVEITLDELRLEARKAEKAYLDYKADPEDPNEELGLDDDLNDPNNLENLSLGRFGAEGTGDANEAADRGKSSGSSKGKDKGNSLPRSSKH